VHKMTGDRHSYEVLLLFVDNKSLLEFIMRRWQGDGPKTAGR